MNRRSFFKAGSKVAMGAAVASQITINKAFAVPGEQILIDSKIESNHGHLLNIDAADVIVLLRKSQAVEGFVETISIQGESRHPHEITLNADQLLMIVLAEELSLASTAVSGHAHSVLVKMNVQ